MCVPELIAARARQIEPPPPSAQVDVADGSSIIIAVGDRNYRMRGIEKNLSYAQLKVVLRVARGELFFLDQVDLVSARQRAQFIRQAAIDVGIKEEVIKHELAAVYRELEALQEQQLRTAKRFRQTNEQRQ